MLLRALLVPIGGLCLGLGVLVGGNVGKGLLIVGTVLFGAATVLTLTD